MAKFNKAKIKFNHKERYSGLIYKKDCVYEIEDVPYGYIQKWIDLGHEECKDESADVEKDPRCSYERPGTGKSFLDWEKAGHKVAEKKRKDFEAKKRKSKSRKEDEKKANAPVQEQAPEQEPEQEPEQAQEQEQAPEQEQEPAYEQEEMPDEEQKENSEKNSEEN